MEEYVDAFLETWLKEHGIKHRTISARSPQSNGVAERINRTLSSHNSSCAYIVQFKAIQARTSISRIVPIAEHSMSSEYLTSNGIRYAPAGVPLFHVGI